MNCEVENVRAYEHSRIDSQFVYDEYHIKSINCEGKSFFIAGVNTAARFAAGIESMHLLCTFPLSNTQVFPRMYSYEGAAIPSLRLTFIPQPEPFLESRLYQCSPRLVTEETVTDPRYSPIRPGRS